MKMTKRTKNYMRTPKILIMNHRFVVTDWKYLEEIDNKSKAFLSHKALLISSM